MFCNFVAIEDSISFKQPAFSLVSFHAEVCAQIMPSLLSSNCHLKKKKKSKCAQMENKNKININN